jgi:hypothetical protein
VALERTEDQEWVDRRVAEVGRAYTAYQALTEAGVEIPDEASSFSVFCPFHDNKRTAAARYYASSGRAPPHFWCWVCKLRLEGVGLYARLKGVGFMEGLTALERRFRISVPRKPEGSPIVPTERNSAYVSQAWADVPRFLVILEGKLREVRPKSGIVEYVKYCRLLDAVQWDFDVTGVATPDMAAALAKVACMMDDVMMAGDPLE